jgi:very-short-patch-repair endonuclease
MAKSELEATVELWLRTLDAPECVREYRFHPTRRWRFDFAWPEKMLAVEVSGFGHHKLSRFKGDIEKFNEAAMLGWRVVRLWTDDIRSGAAYDVLEKALEKAREGGGNE